MINLRARSEIDDRMKLTDKVAPSCFKPSRSMIALVFFPFRDFFAAGGGVVNELDEALITGGKFSVGETPGDRVLRPLPTDSELFTAQCVVALLAPGVVNPSVSSTSRLGFQWKFARPHQTALRDMPRTLSFRGLNIRRTNLPLPSSVY